MSRIIVKGLPPKVSEQKLREHFVKYGTITDCCLKFTKEGKFRRFAFVGFEENECSREAIRKTNNTFLGSYKLLVEECKPFGDSDKPRAWSQYAKDSRSSVVREFAENKCACFRAFKRMHPGEPASNSSNKDERLGKAEAGDSLRSAAAKKKEPLDKDFEEFLEAKGVAVKEKDKVAVSACCAEDKEDHSDLKNELLEGIKGDTSLSLLMTGLPPTIKQKDLRDWLAPVRLKALKVTRNDKFAASFVTFNRPPDVRRSLSKNNQFLAGFRISVDTVSVETEKPRWKREEAKERFSREEDEMKVRDTILDTGRLFLRNLPFQTKEEDLRILFKKFGEIAEIQVIVAKSTGLCKGFAIIEYVFPESALAAFSELDGTIFKGRMLHILPGVEKKVKEEEEEVGKSSSFKKDKENKLKANATKVILVKNLPGGVLGEEIGRLFEKHGAMEKCLMPEGGVSALVIMENAVDAKKAFQALAYARFRTRPLFLEWAPWDIVEGKEDAVGAEETSVQELSEKKAKSKREMTAEEKKEERRSKKHKKEIVEEEMECEVKEEKEEPEMSEPPVKKMKRERMEAAERPEDIHNETENVEEEREVEEGALLFVKNLSFETTDATLTKIFGSKFEIQSAKVSLKLNPADPSKSLSMGFGFVQFYARADAQEALKNMQGTLLDGHCIELKVSNREKMEDTTKPRKGVNRLDQGQSTKIIVRNLPFQATQKELESLFSTFGSVKIVRIPRKVGGKGHRGFGFVDFNTKGDAKRAFNGLVHSTHLYGRRLVLEWAKTEGDDTVKEMREKTAANYSGATREERKMKKRLEAIEKDLRVIDDD